MEVEGAPCSVGHFGHCIGCRIYPPFVQPLERDNLEEPKTAAFQGLGWWLSVMIGRAGSRDLSHYNFLGIRIKLANN